LDFELALELRLYFSFEEGIVKENVSEEDPIILR
jgi:hypothetical protein